MKKRIFVMFLTICVTLSFLIVPANAADDGLHMVDVLPSAGYTKFVNGAALSQTFDQPHNWTVDANSVGWGWNTKIYDDTFQSFIFTMYITGKVLPERVEFTYFSGRTVEAEFIGGSNDVFQYRANVQSNMDQLKIICFFSELFTGNCSVVACVGIRNVERNVYGLEYQQTAYRINRESAYYEATYQNLNVSIPYEKLSTRSSDDYQWVYDSVDIWVDPVVMDNAESVTFLLKGIYFDGFSAYISNKTNELTPVHILECDAINTMSSQVYNTTAQAWPLTFYEVTIDLSGYDLNDCYVHLCFDLKPITYNRPYECTYWSIMDCSFAWDYDELPWYQVFYSWLRPPFELILARLTNIMNTLAGTTSSGSAIQQAGQAMSDQAGVMNDANAQMDAVERPDIDPDQMFGSMLNFNLGSLRLLSAITAQPNVTAMIVVVFTFALCGYIFFGKRK